MESLENTWIFPLVQSVHLVGIAILAGTIAIVDLRLLGFGLKGRTAAQLSAELGGWTRAGLLVMLLTGSVLFGSNATRYLANPAFQFKLVFLLLACALDFGIRDPWVRQPHPPTLGRARLIGLSSMTLWTSVIVAGRGIADFDI